MTNSAFDFFLSLKLRNQKLIIQNIPISANNCDSPTHQCIPLGKCEYFGNLLTNGGTISTVSHELSKLFCGHDGLGVLVRISSTNFPEERRKKMQSRKP